MRDLQVGDEIPTEIINDWIKRDNRNLFYQDKWSTTKEYPFYNRKTPRMKVTFVGMSHGYECFSVREDEYVDLRPNNKMPFKTFAMERGLNLDEVVNKELITKDYSYTKIVIPTEEVGIAVQKELFKHGVRWLIGSSHIQNIVAPYYLYISRQLVLQHGLTSLAFSTKEEREVFVEDILQNKELISNTHINQLNHVNRDNIIGKTIVVPTKEATITRGQRPTGVAVTGRLGRATIQSRRLNNTGVSGQG